MQQSEVVRAEPYGVAKKHAGRASFRCCGVRVDPMTLDEAVEELIEVAGAGEGRAVHLCNAYTLSLARRDPAYRGVVDRGDLNLPDGMPLLWVGRRLGIRIDTSRRPRGTDVFLQTVRRGQERGLRHYLYGSTPGVVVDVASRLRELAPGVDIVGVESPPFRPLNDDESADLVARIREAHPDVVWVGLGTPRQDEFVSDYRDRIGATLVAVGAAFDFIAGTKPEAPAWMKSAGLEWLFRLKSEPRRLWARYLVGNSVFLYDVLRGGAVIEPR